MQRSSGLVCLQLALAFIALLAAACGGPAKVPETSVDPQLVTLEGSVSNKFVKTGEVGSLFARVRIGTRAVTERTRGPVNIALVIDTSGSMEGKAIEDARNASLAMLDALSPGDRVAVVTFDSKERVLLPSTVLSDSDRDDVKKQIREMKAQGTTDMARGLRAGLAQVLTGFDVKNVNRIVLLGDGVPNDKGPIAAIAQEAGGSGITITALGLGEEYDETLMGQIAQKSGGKFHYIDDSQKVAEFFQSEVLRLQGVYAKNAVVRFTPGPGVRIEEVVGQQASRDGASMQLPIGDVTKGDSRDLIVRLSLDPRKGSSAVELLDAVLTFDDATADAGRLERSLFLGARSTAQDAEIDKGRDVDVELSAALVQAAATTVAALEAARIGDAARAREMLLRGAEAAEAQAKRTPSAELTKQAANMRGLATDLPKPTAQRPTADVAVPMPLPAATALAPSPIDATPARAGGGKVSTAPGAAGRAAPPIATAHVQPPKMPAPPSPAAPPPQPFASPAKARQAHDEAMRHLQ